MKSLGLRVFKMRSLVGLSTMLFVSVLLSARAFSDAFTSASASCPTGTCDSHAIPKTAPLSSIPVSWDDIKNDRLGNCLLPPDYIDILKEWRRFQAIATLKTTLNAQQLAAKMKVSDETQKYLQDLRKIEPLVKDLSVIKNSKWFKNKFAPRGQVDKDVLTFSKSSEFFDNIASASFVEKQNKDFHDAYGFPPPGGFRREEVAALTFRDAVDNLQQELKSPEVRMVLTELDRKSGISMVDPVQMAHYEEFMGFFEAKSDGSPAVRNLLEGQGETPLQSEIPLPTFSIKDNVFQKEYLENVHKGMDHFIWHNPISEDMLAPHLKDKISTGETLMAALNKMLEKERSVAAADEWGGGPPIPTNLTEMFNDASAPARLNLFDEKVATQFYSNVRSLDVENRKDDTTPPKMAPGEVIPGTATLDVIYQGKTIKMDAAKLSQVDMVARTLAGEVMDCQSKGLAQAEAVGIVIAQRISSIKASVDEESKVQDNNHLINAANVVISNGDSKSLIKNEDTRLLGRRDFGRPPPPFPTSLPPMPAAEVVSRKLQFSVWNPNLPQNHSTAWLTKNRNIPEYTYPIFGPLSSQAIIAQTRALCPEVPKNSKKGNTVNTKEMKLWPGDLTKSKPIWDHINDLALEIVQDPQGYLNRYTWNPAPEQKNHIYFYTHGPKLNFAREVDVKSIHDNVTHKDLPLRYQQSAGGSPGSFVDSCNHFRAFAPENVGLYESSKSQ